MDSSSARLHDTGAEAQPEQPTAEVAPEPAAVKEEAPPAAEPVAAPEPKKRARKKTLGSKKQAQTPAHRRRRARTRR